jgi:hypothetical protein
VDAPSGISSPSSRRVLAGAVAACAHALVAEAADEEGVVSYGHLLQVLWMRHQASAAPAAAGCWRVQLLRALTHAQ